MDDTIKYTDLFDADFVTRINEVATALQGMNGEIKNIAAAVLGSAQSLGNTTTALAQLTAQVNALQQAQRQVQQAQQATNAVMKGMSTLTDAERKSVEDLTDQLERLRMWRMFGLQSIDTTKKSYNELKASYNAIVNSLRKMTDEEQRSTAAGQTMTEQARSLRDALKNMDNAYRKAAQGVQQLSAVQKRFPKLQQFEVANVETFSQQLAALRQNLTQTLPAIDMQNASYNQLYATYNILKDSLNQMTTEERNNTAAGQTMTEQARKLMEQLNALQQATGKYTLNVGNYASAFDGFGYSIQQVLREIPSATTLNQFFLAISNNIPMVADQIRKFTMEQTELHRKANEAMQAGNKEAADAIAAQYQTLGKKIISSVLNWQSAVLAVLLVLRKYGSQAVQWIIELFKGVEQVRNAMSKVTAMTTLFFETFKQTREVGVELRLLRHELNDLTQGSDEWQRVVGRVNELTHSNLNAVTATKKEVGEVTKAYLEQVRQIAKNKLIVEKIAKSDENVLLRRMILGGKDISNYTSRRWGTTTTVTKLANYPLETVASLLGLTADSKEYKELAKLYNKAAAPFGSYTSASWTEFSKNQQRYINFIKSRTPIISQAAMQAYIPEYEAMVEKEEKGRARSTKERIQLMSDLWEEYMQNRHKLQQDEFKREQEAENDRYELQVIGLEKEYQERAKNYKEQIKDKQALKDTLAELGKQYDALVEIAEQEHYDKLMQIEDDFTAREIKSAQEMEEQKLKILEDAAAKELKIRKKRVKNAQDEIYNNAIVTQNVNTYIALVKQLEHELQTLDIPDEGETAQKIQEKIKKYNEIINKELANYATSQQTKKIGSLWDIVGGGINFSEDFKKGVLQKMGINTALIKDTEMIEGLFQNWLDEAEAAFGDWASKIRDTLSGLLDAYVEFYNARAEAAAEDTEAAKEEYEKQKALLEAGYASSIEKEWAAYQEKKRIQKQAEKEAELWNERQRQLSQLETVASLGTAIANLFKSLTAGGAVGVAIAAAASAALLGAFTQAQQQANSVVKYGAGHVETIQGGSHASGHDSPLAYDSQGRERRVEGGEMFAVINRKAVGRYGNGMIEDVINSINAMNYKGVDAVKVAMVGTDLSKIERNLDTLVGNSDGRVMMDADGNMIVKRNNFTKKISFQRTALS